MTENIKEIALKACDIINEKLGTDIVCLDITHMTVIADYFVIAIPTMSSLSMTNWKSRWRRWAIRSSVPKVTRKAAGLSWTLL